jgi:hypothetical protein
VSIRGSVVRAEDTHPKSTVGMFDNVLFDNSKLIMLTGRRSRFWGKKILTDEEIFNIPNLKRPILPLLNIITVEQNINRTKKKFNIPTFPHPNGNGFKSCYILDGCKQR